jgi:hypothetical protein
MSVFAIGIPTEALVGDMHAVLIEDTTARVAHFDNDELIARLSSPACCVPLASPAFIFTRPRALA